MAMKESGEMYLETILVLSRRLKMVRAIDVGEEMGYSKPSVSRAMHLLKDRGYIDVQADGAITLTDEGRAIAENIYDRHNVLAQALRSIGVDEQTAVDDACRVEHYISEATFQAIKAHLEKKQ
ncbi:MAG: metal-dependent transcriptional regulator [Firmicutes bacterium]|nr:metal-dependent transcriptional regulator [Bacillota bacterium]